MASAAFIVAAKRTPVRSHCRRARAGGADGRAAQFGAFGGSLKSHTAASLGGIASKAALAQLPAETKVDSVIFGSVLQSDPSGAYLARHVGHHAGLPVTVPALTVNRLCGSGFESAIRAAQEIKLGESHVVLSGGAENMSLSPYTLSGSNRFGTRYGVDLKLEDSLAHALTDRVPSPTPMMVTAENLADKYSITREDCDKYAVQSQHRYGEGLAAGAFADEIVPIELSTKKGPVTLDKDEHPRPKVDLAAMAKLPAVAKKGGTVSAGNASGICDGGSANVVASEEGIKRFGLKPLARIVAYHTVAVEPTIMGIGPVEAIKGALARAGLGIEDIDLFDVNEAFAAQWLSVQKELGLPSDKSNVFGGAIGLSPFSLPSFGV